MAARKRGEYAAQSAGMQLEATLRKPRSKTANLAYLDGPNRQKESKLEKKLRRS